MMVHVAYVINSLRRAEKAAGLQVSA